MFQRSHGQCFSQNATETIMAYSGSNGKSNSSKFRSSSNKLSTSKQGPSVDFTAAKIPIVDACQRLGIDVDSRGYFLCPAHDDKGGGGRGNAHVTPDPLKWTCFACGAGGDSSDLISTVEGATAAEVAKASTGKTRPVREVKSKRAPQPKIDYSTNHGWNTFEECLRSSLDYHVREHEASATKFVVYDYTPTFKRVRFVHRDTGKKIGPKPFEVHNNGKWYPNQNDADKDRLLPLYGGGRLAEIGPLVTQVIVEGEKCADLINALTSEAFPFVAVTSANGGESAAKTDWCQLRGDRKIIIWPDADKTGGTFRDTVARLILSSGKWNDVSLVQGEAVDDLLDGLGESSPEVAILQYLDDHSKRVRSSAMAARIAGGIAESVVISEDLGFMLETPNGESLFPLGMLSSVSGDGGTGKSLFLKYLSAAIANGEDFFHYTINPKYAGGLVCYLSQDEGGEGPRADIMKIGCNSMDRIWSPGKTEISTMAEIRDQITRYMSLLPGERLSLVVVDTGDDYLSEKSQGNNDGSVKSDLNHLRVLAEDTGASVVFTKHFSKAKCRLRDRIMGSQAWTAKPRQSIVIARDPAAGPDDVFVGIAKSNVGRWPATIGYMRLKRSEPGIIPSVTFTASDDEFNAVEARIIESETGGASPSIKIWPNDQIITWIIRTIRDADNHEMSGIELDERASDAGIPKNRYKDVRADLKANDQIAHTHPKHGSVKWFIPDATTP